MLLTWQHIIAYSNTNTFFKFLIIQMQLPMFHQCIGGKLPVPRIGKEMQTGSNNNPISWIFLMLASPCNMASSTIALVCYKGNLNGSSTLPIQQAIAYSIRCSKRKKGNIFYTRWQQNCETKEHRLPRSEAYCYHLSSSHRPHFSLVPTFKGTVS
jgi:hypothetical protein